MFCKDFEFYGEGKLSREEAVEVFKKNAKYAKYASPEELEKIITSMTEKIYNDNKDITNISKKMYEILCFEDQTNIKKKLKLWHLPFNSKSQISKNNIQTPNN